MLLQSSTANRFIANLIGERSGEQPHGPAKSMPSPGYLSPRQGFPVAAVLNVASLDFDLPPELEAAEPPEARGLARDEVRLMVSYRGGSYALPQFGHFS